MGFVKSADEVQRIQDLLAAGRFTVEGLSIEFETSPDFVAHVLPPCLTAVEEALGVVAVTRWQSAFCGEFDAAAVRVHARYDGIEGLYTLSLLVSGDMPVTIGREMWGEVKKTGTMGLYRDGNMMYGFGERNGVRIIEIEGELGPDQGTNSVDFVNLEIRAEVASSGIGLYADPRLLILNGHADYRSTREGEGFLRLNGTPYDPVDTIPIVSVGRVTHFTGESVYSVSQEIVLSDGDKYLPYLFGRHYDDFSLFPIPRRYAIDNAEPTLTTS